ncbi:MAG: hypothetical protein IT435_07540 [Phycisphaerales bacterium]|nr:hypothetical protein [Phycisphaerales bacterium]
MIRRGSFTCVPRLVETITAYIDAHNDDPEPFVWTAGVQDILQKVRRARATLDKVEPV